jgi:hypothetical protein
MGACGVEALTNAPSLEFFEQRLADSTAASRSVLWTAAANGKLISPLRAPEDCLSNWATTLRRADR